MQSSSCPKGGYLLAAYQATGGRDMASLLRAARGHPPDVG